MRDYFLSKHSGMCSHGPGREDHIARISSSSYGCKETGKRPGVGQGDKISVLVAIIYPLVPVEFYKYAECARSLRPYLRLSARLLTARGTRLILFDLPDVRKELQLNAPEANLTPLKISKAALAYPAIDH